MLVKLEKIDVLFKEDFKKLISMYKFSTLRKHIIYKDYYFICDIYQDELSTSISISSDFAIFYNDDYTKLTKDKLKDILNERIRKRY